MKKILTFDDLYKFVAENNLKHFDCKEKDNSPIAVNIVGKLKFENNNNTEGLTPVLLRANHTGRNLNGSFISDESQNNALESFKNRPILGCIHEVDGEPHFWGHNMHLDENDEIVYDEIPIGVIPESSNPHLEYNEEFDLNQVVVKGYIFDEYTKAAEIMQREEELSVSVELCIKEFSFNAKENYLSLDDFYYSGVTILGVDEDGNEVKPGMAHSNITLADFSVDVSQEQFNKDMIKRVADLEEKLASFNINNIAGKEEVEVENKEIFEEETKEVEETTEEVIEEATEEETTEVTKEMSEEETVDTPEVQKENKEFSKIFEVRFELSHDDIRWGLYNLIEQFDELDNDYYFIRAVYDDYFVMQGWCNNSIYGCKYVKSGDNVSLDGERWKLYEELLTETEKNSLEEMRSNYSVLSDELKSYKIAEENAKKEEILKDKSYSEFLEKEHFKELIKDIEKYSVDEFREKAELAFAKCIKDGFTFSLHKENVIRAFNNPVVKAEKKPYGDLFDD